MCVHIALTNMARLDGTSTAVPHRLLRLGRNMTHMVLFLEMGQSLCDVFPADQSASESFSRHDTMIQSAPEVQMGAALIPENRCIPNITERLPTRVTILRKNPCILRVHFFFLRCTTGTLGANMATAVGYPY